MNKPRLAIGGLALSAVALVARLVAQPASLGKPND